VVVVDQVPLDLADHRLADAPVAQLGMHPKWVRRATPGR
jgi:hypothetical protein